MATRPRDARQSASHDLGPSQAAEMQAAQGATRKRTKPYVDEERRRPAPQIRRAGAHGATASAATGEVMRCALKPQLLLEPARRRQKALLERDLRLPAEQGPRAGDVGPALLRIVLGQGPGG